MDSIDTTYLLAVAGGVVAVILVALFGRSRAPSKVKAKLTSQHGLTFSTQALKDERLSPDFILSAIEDGVVVVRRDNIIHLFNPAASRISGWPPAEAVGLNFQNVLSLTNDKGDPFPASEHPFAKVLAQNTPVKESSWLATRGGKRIPISLIVSPVLDSQGRPTNNVVGVFRDITQEKEEEAQRSEFISTASHEMRTPLAAIDGYLALSLNPKISKLDSNARKYLEKALSATQHLSVLFRDLLTSSRAEDGRLASYPVVVELGEITEQVADAARFKAKEKGLELRYVVSSDKDVAGGKVIRPLYYTFADANRIREVLQNLIDNGIKYTVQGEIVIRLTGNATVVQVQVQDTGPGIPLEDVPHLFQKFYRVDNSMTRSVGGSGLGLFISRKIVELYNGRIWVESELGKGSTFFMNLPRLTSSQALEMQKKQAATFSPLDNP